MRVIGIRRVNWRFVHSRQVSDNKRKIESLRDSNNKRVSNINDKIHVLKEHYQKLGREKHVESFENEWENTRTIKD